MKMMPMCMLTTAPHRSCRHSARRAGIVAIFVEEGEGLGRQAGGIARNGVHPNSGLDRREILSAPFSDTSHLTHYHRGLPGTGVRESSTE